MHVAGNALGFVAGVLIGVASERVVARLRNRLYSHILSQEMAFFDEHKSGELVSRLGSDTLLVQQATTTALNEAIIGFFKVVASIALMFVTSWQLTLIVFGTILFYLCAFVGPLSQVVAQITKQYQEALSKAASASTEAMGAMRTVRSFAAESTEQARYGQHIGRPDGRWWPDRGDDTTYRHGARKALFSTLLISSGFTIVFGALSAWLLPPQPP